MISNAPQPESFEFTPENLEKCKAIIAKYPEGKQRSAVMPIMDLAQRQEGWLTTPAMNHIAEMLEMPPIKVYEVATFYTMYNLEPKGEHHVQICTNISCWLRDSDAVVKAAHDVFGDFNEVTEDGKAYVQEVECLGACCNAPMVQINDDYFEDLDYDSAKAIFEAIKAGEPLKPGSAKGRQCSMPEGGQTTLLEGGA